MSFENATNYRSADCVHAVRLTTEGNIPITHSEDDWLKALRADGRVHFVGLEHGFRVTPVKRDVMAVWARAGDWIVWHDRSDVAEALSDAVFRERYEVLEEGAD